MPTGDALLLRGRYRLVAPLDSESRVYRAEDTQRGGRAVVVHRVAPALLARPETAARFAARVRALEVFAHPAIAGVLDHGVEDSGAFVVSEVAPGEPLAAWIARARGGNAEISWVTVEGMLGQLCDGLGALHAERANPPLAHGALDATCVRAADTPSGLPQIKVLDVATASLEREHAARTGAALGLTYVAPEQALGEVTEATPACDVFSIAVLAVEMLTGDPFVRPGQAWWASSVRHAGSPLALLASRRADVPGAVWEVLASALHREPSARYPDATALGRALREGFAGRAVEPPVSALAPAIAAPLAPVAPATTTPLLLAEPHDTIPGPALAPPAPPAPTPALPARTRESRTQRAALHPVVLASASAVAGAMVAIGAVYATGEFDRTPVAAVGGGPASESRVLDSPRIPVGDSPVAGPSDALATIVVFGDFACPYSRRAAETLRTVRNHYGHDVRIVWKNNPLPAHENARLASAAAMAANAQGRFWQMHDQLFAHPEALDRGALERHAAALGLDLARFRHDLDGPALRAVDADIALAARLHARGTPTFFINGTPVTGAQPYERFTALLDRVLDRARGMGDARDLYARMVADPVSARDEARPPPDEPIVAGQVYTVPPAPDAPTRGAPDALVTIDHFADFQCPFCARAAPTLDAILRAYGDRVRIRWRDDPLTSHPDALPAAEAAREALAQQGPEGFWRYHDALLAHQSALAREDLERYARAQSLDLTRFRAALDHHTHLAEIRADQDALATTGLHPGTPATFVNGRYLEGAQPVARLAELVDAALASWPESH